MSDLESGDEVGSVSWLASAIGSHGREAELAILSDAYQRSLAKNENPPEMIALSGVPGVGKTHLVEHSACAVDASDIYFISGKFDQRRSQQPYSAIHKAFTLLCQRLLAEDREVVSFIIMEKMGGNHRILTDLFPMLRDVIGYRDTAPEIIGTAEAQNRFNFVFRNFLRTISRYKPVVLFIDDLQWADADSLDLMRALLEDKSIKRFLLVGAYRSNEVGPGDDLAKIIQDLATAQVPITSIEILGLPSKTVEDLIGKTFPTDGEVKELAKIVYTKTEGSPLHVLRLLRYLVSERLLVFESDLNQWQWEIEEIKSIETPSTVEDLIVREIRKQPLSVVHLLKIGAALGTYFDDYAISLIIRSGVDIQPTEGEPSMSVPDFESLATFKTSLKAAIANGFLLENGKLGYKFFHDKVQQAAYNLIEEDSRGSYHLEIGRLMVRNANLKRRSTRTGRRSSMCIISQDDISDFLSRQLFVAVDQLNKGKELITEEREKENLIILNLRAAEVAAESASVLSSKTHLDIGTTILNSLSAEPWQSKYYDLCLQLHTKMAEVELALGNYTLGERLAKAVLDNARSMSEKLPVQYALINALSRQEKFLESFLLSRTVLRALKVYPKFFVALQTIRRHNEVKGLLKRNSDEEILSLPKLENKQKVFAMELLRVSANNAFMSKQLIDFLLTDLLRIRMSFDHGRSDEMAVAFATHAISLAMFGDEQGAVRCAKLATRLLKLNKGKRLEGLVLFMVYRFINSWSDTSAAVMCAYRRGYATAMDSGDVEVGFVNWYQSIWHALDSGSELGPLLKSLEENVEQAKLYNASSIVNPARFFVSCIKHFSSIEPLEWDKIEAFEPNEEYEVQTLVWIYLAWLFTAVFFRKYMLAQILASKLFKVGSHDASYNVLNLRLYCTGLMAAGLAHETGKPKYESKLRKCERQLKKLADKKGTNCRHRQLLLKAEWTALKSKDLAKSRNAYDKAICVALESQHLQDVALGNELAGESMLRKGDETSTAKYLTHAWMHYRLWGAHEKALEMERNHESRIDTSKYRASKDEWLSLDFISSSVSPLERANQLSRNLLLP